MAVKASATITLTSYRDTQSVTRYYKLQTAGSSAPSKPTTKPPSSDWTDSEPACDISKELYFCDLTIFSNGEWEYSKVSKSSSYEAAKQAYNKAQGAKDSIDNLEIGGRNLFIETDYENIKTQGSASACGWYNVNDLIARIVDDNSEKAAKMAGNEWTVAQYVNVEAGKTYTMSCFARLETERSGAKLQFRPDVLQVLNLNFDKDLTTNYQKFTYTWTCGVGGIERIHIRTGDANDVLYVKKIKFEKGNKATDWSPAPEDVDAGIDEANSNALTAQEEANALDEDLTDFKSNEYSQINDKVGELVEYKGENEKEIGKIRDELSQELVAQKFARVEPDKGSLILGEINGTTAVLTNEQFGFYTPNSEIAAAYFGKDNDAWAFNIERGIIKNDLRFSGFQWIARSNKNMSLKWIK